MMRWRHFLIFCWGALLLASGSTLAHGQERLDPGPFKGFWVVREPAGDRGVLNIKSGGELSCFWAGPSAGNEILQGTWERTGDRLLVTWPTGHRDVFTVLSETALQRQSFEPGMPLDGPAAYEVRAIQLDPRQIGSLARAGDATADRPRIGEAPAANASPAALRNPYIGYWSVEQTGGLMGLGNVNEPFYLQLARGGEAQMALRNWAGDSRAIGQWKLVDEQAEITWPDGRRDVLTKNADGAFVLRVYGRKERPEAVRSAQRVTFAEAERHFHAATVNLITVDDVRGRWQPHPRVEAESSFNLIVIDAWGEARLHPRVGSTIRGEWKLLTDQVVINWPDGSHDVLRLTVAGILMERFGIGEDISGQPSRRVPLVKEPDGSPLANQR